MLRPDDYSMPVRQPELMQGDQSGYCGEIPVELPVVEAIQLDIHRLLSPGRPPGQPEERGEPLPGGVG